MKLQFPPGESDRGNKPLLRAGCMPSTGRPTGNELNGILVCSLSYNAILGFFFSFFFKKFTLFLDFYYIKNYLTSPLHIYHGFRLSVLQDSRVCGQVGLFFLYRSWALLFLLICFVLFWCVDFCSYYITLNFIYPLEVCLFVDEGQKEGGSGWEGRLGGAEGQL